MRTLCLGALAGVMLLALTGCITMGSSMAASSVPLEGRDYTELGPASGSFHSFYLFGILPISTGGTQDAHAKAIEESGADGLTSVSVDNIVIPVPIIGTWYITKVEGTAIKFR
jgi:hypothetical protein